MARDITSRGLDGLTWIPQSRDAKRPEGREAPPGNQAVIFLQRDLNEDALRKPTERLFSHTELTEIRQEGVDAGYEAGLQAAAASQAAFRTASEARALEIISASIKDGSLQAASIADAAAAALAKALFASMQAMMPDLIRRSALSETAAMLAHVLPGLSREPAIRIEVPHELTGYIEATFASLAPEQRDKISVTGEDNMGPGEARISWGTGQARRQPAMVWQAVIDALQPVLGHSGSEDSDNGE